MKYSYQMEPIVNFIKSRIPDIEDRASMSTHIRPRQSIVGYNSGYIVIMPIGFDTAGRPLDGKRRLNFYTEKDMYNVMLFSDYNERDVVDEYHQISAEEIINIINKEIK